MKVYSYFPLQILISFINVCSASAIRLIPNQSYNDSSLQINNQITALMESRHGLSSGGFHVHCHACASCLAKNGGKRLFLAEEMKGRIRWLQRGVAQLDAAHACIWVCMHVAPTYTYICVRTCFADVHCCIGFYSKFWCCAPSSNFDQRSLFNQSRTSQRRFSYRLILRVSDTISWWRGQTGSFILPANGWEKRPMDGSIKIRLWATPPKTKAKDA